VRVPLCSSAVQEKEEESSVTSGAETSDGTATATTKIRATSTETVNEEIEVDASKVKRESIDLFEIV